MTVTGEVYGRGSFDALDAIAEVDWPLVEFWSTDNRWALTAKAVTSAAQLSGAQVVGAEAFTATAKGSRWDAHPYALKAQGDKMFTTGINRYFPHVYVLQPWSNRFPGMTLASYGAHFNRHQTWWKPARAWFDYLARCQFLLQQGRPEADICLAIATENSPANGITGSLGVPDDPFDPTPAFIPKGYDFSICPPDRVIRDMTIKNGRPSSRPGFPIR